MTTVPNLNPIPVVTGDDLLISHDITTNRSGRVSASVLKDYIVDTMIADGEILSTDIPHESSTVGVQLNKRVKVVENISSLSSDSSSIGEQVSIRGHTTPGVGGGLYDVLPVSSYSNNGGTVVVSGSKAYVKKLNEYHLDDFGGNLVQAIAAAANGILKIKSGTVNLPATPITITQPIVIECDSQGNVIFNKTAAVDAFRIHSPHVKMRRFQITGSVVGDTSSDIVIGRNDGANGQNVGNGYISAAQCVIEDALLTGGGNRGIDWQEGPFAVLKNVHSFSHKQNNFYVSDKAFDASHGEWFTNSAGALADGYSINFGTHSFILIKSFSDGGRGVYLNYSRGSTGNVFVELPTGAFLQFGPNTLANNINAQFWTAGKNYVDQGIGNKITGMSLGDNSGGCFDSFVRTNKIIVQDEFVPAGGTVRSGGLLLTQTANNVMALGEISNTSQLNIIGTTSGVALRDIAYHPKVYDGTAGGTTQDLTPTNSYIGVYILSNGQTLRINGASGTGYTPFDGQRISVRMSGAGTVSVYGKIDGSLVTDTITTTNRSKSYIWIASQGFWFPD